ncbi:IPT/TIG domain-containing protein [Paenibacillus xylanilyticus]|uniref:IPT/TIG domain-containing protein n=1 Tax=Paenibacillus xylanilyticus TaxID=248903 RepID=UPI00129EADD4|nr:IPT/TIG domain-containing protein [Paenibacillus xylanilyticus]
MRKLKKMLVMMLVFLLGVSSFPFTSQAATDYVSATKMVNPSSILVGEEAEVTLSIQGTPPVNVVKPNDVILVIDKSGSMGQEKMNSAKAAAKGFIDLMDLTKHQVGIVDYQSSPSKGVELTSDATTVKKYIDTINSGGGTGTASAIDKAREMLDSHRADAQPVIVLLTDGDATEAGDGLNAYQYSLKKAEEAKNAGIVFYTIALLDQSTNPETSGPNKLMKDMATTSHHHHFVLGSTGLSDIYAAIVKEIGLASAYDVVVTDIVPDNFEIVPDSYNNNIPKPIVSGNTLTWSFLELKKDTLSFTYKIRQKTDGIAGKFPVTKNGSKITYKDYTGVSRDYVIPSSNLTIKYPAPTITNVTPNKAIVDGGEKVVIEGQHFLPGAMVKFGGYFSSSVDWISDGRLEVIVPSGNQGNVQLTVYNTDNQSATANFDYYADPEVDDLQPASGPMTGGTNMVISGKYFMTGVKVKVGEGYSSNVTRHSSIYLFASTPPSSSPGPVDVVIENPDGTQITLPNAFTYDTPPQMELTEVTPGEGYTTGNETVTLTGQLFEKSSKVYFGDVEAQGLVFYSKNKITVKSPTWSQEETVDVKVVNTDGTISTLPQAFKYVSPPPPNAPSIDSINPSNGPLVGGTTVYIDGKDFVSGAKVVWGASEIKTTFINSSRLMIVTPPWTSSEAISVGIVNPDMQSVSVDSAFTYDAPPKLPAPTLKSISPSSGPLVGKTTVYVDGTGFNSNSKLFFTMNGQDVDLNAVYVNAKRMMITTPAGLNPGPVDLKVLNSDDQSALMTSAFTYDAPPIYPDPVISSINPNTGNMRGGYVIDIFGTDFQREATVMFGSTPLTLTAYMNSSNVRVTVPAVLVTGKVDITLTNPDGKSSTLVGGFEYKDDIPTITKLSPNSGPMTGGTLVYVDGSYFAQGMIVTVDGIEVSHTYINSKRIMLTTPARANPGTVEIRITNPSGLSAAMDYTYDAPPALPAPVVTGVSPSSGPVAGGTYIYIDGRNIVSGGMINFNGVNYPSTFVNSKRAMFRVPAAASPGVVSFFIINPDGQASGTLNFEYK